jgi:hypothetical protein
VGLIFYIGSSGISAIATDDLRSKDDDFPLLAFFRLQAHTARQPILNHDPLYYKGKNGLLRFIQFF